jgi:hypothetical protein
MPDGCGRKKGADPIFPLIFEKRVVNNNQCFDFQLGSNVESTHRFPATSLETDHSVAGFGFEISVHHLYLGRADRPCEGPAVRGRCARNFRSRFTPSFNPELFGNVNEVLGLVVNGILFDIPGVHEDRGDVGFHSKFFPQSIEVFNRGFRDFVPVAG